MDLNKFAQEVHNNACAHGWWEKEPSFAEVIALCHSELSEALEEYRNERPTLYYPCNDGRVCDTVNCGSKTYNPADPEAPCTCLTKKPEGISIELADCILRIFDYCGKENIDIEDAIRRKHEYNKTRPYKHGNKKI